MSLRVCKIGSVLTIASLLASCTDAADLNFEALRADLPPGTTWSCNLIKNFKGLSGKTTMTLTDARYETALANTSGFFAESANGTRLGFLVDEAVVLGVSVQFNGDPPAIFELKLDSDTPSNRYVLEVQLTRLDFLEPYGTCERIK